MKEIRECRITSIKPENPMVKTFSFLPAFEHAQPGQFTLASFEGCGGIPLSFSEINSLTVKRIAHDDNTEDLTSTEKMHELDEGDTLYLHEPLGNGFHLYDRNSVFIAGGIGAAPLIPAIRKVGRVEITKTFLGAKTKSELVPSNIFEYSDLYISTDDGTAGEKGTVVDLLKKKIEERPQDYKGIIKYLMCGPEKMMKSASEYLVERGVKPEDIQLSLERYMKCARGLCGTCSCGGYRVCVDGPVFTYDIVMKLEDFGKWKRDASGEKVPI